MVTTRLDFWYKQNANGFYDSPRPQKEFTIRSCGREEWIKFRKYHYLNTEIASACQCYGLFDANNDIIGFMGVLHQPHGINKKIKRVSRLVILPDYQGIGLGSKFLNEIAKIYVNNGYDFSIKTSAKNLINSLKKQNNWCLISYGISNCTSNKSAIDYKRSSLRNNCKTASFFYKK